MWNYHLRGLRHDLWRSCPPKLAQSIYAAVLDDSLAMLARRYAAARPSYARMPQLRSEVIDRSYLLKLINVII